MFNIRRSLALSRRAADTAGNPSTASLGSYTRPGSSSSAPKLAPLAYKPSRNGGYTQYTGIVVDDEPIPKIQALQRRLERVLGEMPEDYSYRVTMGAILTQEMALVDQYQSDLDELEAALGQEHIEMYMRQLRMELRCARSLADEKPWGELFAPAPENQWKWPI